MNTFFKKWFHSTASAIVYASVSSTALPSSHRRLNWVVSFVLHQQAAMPDFLRFPIIALTLVFDLFGLFLFFGFFHKQCLRRRQIQLEFWRNSSFGPCRDFVRFYDSLATLAWTETSVPFFDQENSRYAPALVGLGTPSLCQVTVLGSGPGGAITAALLAEKGFVVLLIEQGKQKPIDSCRSFSIEEMLQKYRNGGLTPALGRPKVAYVEGSCVGGGSEVNSGLYHRTPSVILQQWREKFALDVGETDLLSHFEACEKDVSVGLSPGKLPSASLKLHEGAQALGWDSREVPRWFAYSGNTDSAGIPTGHRQSMSRTFIKRFEAAGGKLKSGIRCRQILRHGDGFRILASEEESGSNLEYSCENLFVSCGAIGTPTILRKSGIKGRIGQSLQMHPTIKVVAEFDEEVNSESMGVPVHQVKEFAPNFSFGCSISSLPYLSLAMLDHPAHISRVAHSWKRMAIYYAMIVPSGSGSVSPLPGFCDPLVKFALTTNDLRMLATALRRLCQLLFAARAIRLFPSISNFGPLENVSQLSRIPEILPAHLANLMTIHLFSSCPMGENPALCPVDSLGLVKGYPGLHIADASLLPSAPGVNPQGSVMAFARRNALAFAEKNILN